MASMDKLQPPPLVRIAYYFGCLIAVYFVFFSILTALIAVHQEIKIWRPRALPSLSWFGCCKVFCLNIVWYTITFLGCPIVLLRYFGTFGKSDVQCDINRLVEDYAARVMIHLIVGDVHVVGMENLPDETMNPAPVYICNHASQIDAAAVYFINRRFKWIAKKSVVYLPGVGQVMWLGGHVLINRNKGKNKSSVSDLFTKSNDAVRSGIPMFFFPQGTRRMDTALKFKDGAFIVAQTNQCIIVPLSLEVPRNVWNEWYPFSFQRPIIKLTIHNPIKSTGKEDREVLKKKCFDQIYSVLPLPTLTLETSSSFSKST